jgi:hypothetical protein
VPLSLYSHFVVRNVYWISCNPTLLSLLYLALVCHPIRSVDPLVVLIVYILRRQMYLKNSLIPD